MTTGRVALALAGLLAAGCVVRRLEPPPAPVPMRWGFGVDDLARVEALSGAARVRLPVPQEHWGEIVAALDSAREGGEPGPLAMRSPVLRFALVRGGELRLDLIGRDHWWLASGDEGKPLAPCPALKAACGLALRLACAAGADEIVVARVVSEEGGTALQVVRTLKGSVAARLRVEGQPLPLPGPRELCLAFLRAESPQAGPLRYHRLLPVGTIWEHSRKMEAKVRESIPLPEAWGEAVAGLRMGLRARESEVVAGAEVAIEIAIQNVGTAPATVLQHRAELSDAYPATRFAVTASDGSRRDVERGLPDGEAGEPLVQLIPPGETYIHTVRLSQWGDFRQPGLYEIACTYSQPPGKEASGSWAGTLASPPIKLRVRPAVSFRACRGAADLLATTAEAVRRKEEKP